MEIIKKTVKSKAFLAFMMGLILYILVFLPDLILNKGILYGSGDYNCQTVPFFYHVRESIVEGKNLVWDFSGGLGAQFFSTYAHVILSPFTFIFLIVPESAMPYAIFYVTALKTGVASLTSYFYIKRFVKNPHYAVIGSLLYSFSSFNAWNLVYIFMDFIAFFPLFLISLDELCINNRRGVFALSVLLMALLNVSTFYGIAVFCVLYFFIRCADKNDGFRLKDIFKVAGEAILGCLMAMILFLPVIKLLSANSRAGNFIQPEDMLFYSDIYDYLRIIQSAFMIPDPFGFISLFPEMQHEYEHCSLFSSIAAFIPLFSAAGVISYVWARKKNWMSWLIITGVVMAFVPVLNNAFFAFNATYYARWYFMPMLICVIVSVKALEEQISFKPGIIVSVTVFAALLVCQILIDPIWVAEASVSNVTVNPLQNILHFAVTAISLIMLIIIVNAKRDKEFIPKLYIFTIVGCYSVFGIMAYYFLTGAGYMEKDKLISYYNYNIPLPEEIDTDARIAHPKLIPNYNLVWGLDSTYSFISVYDAGYQEFCEDTGFVYSNGRYATFDSEYHELNDLLSVKYVYRMSEVTNDKLIPAAQFGVGTFYENPNYIPMGFTYDTMINAEDINKVELPRDKIKIYMKHLLVENPEEFADILTLCDENEVGEIGDEEYAEIIARRKSETCYDLVKNNTGLTAKIDLSRENLVFFSISHNEGWKAYVDGAEVEVHNVNNGMIGVVVPEGTHDIRLEYTIPGFAEGAAISIAATVAFVVYLIICKRKDKKQCP